MSGKIELTPAELKAQANEMNALEREYTALFTGIQTELKGVNSNWSSNLSHNFEGKISSVQRKCLQLTTDLSNGAKIAETSAITFESVDSQLSKLYTAGGGGYSRGGGGQGASGGGGSSGTRGGFRDSDEENSKIKQVDIGNYCENVSDTEYAWLCNLAYKAFKGETTKNPQKEFIRLLQDDKYLSKYDPIKNIKPSQVSVTTSTTGFSSIVISDGENAIVIFVGSDQLQDWSANVAHLFFQPSHQSNQANKIIRDLSKKYSNITVTGHSLGGYLAISTALENSTVSKCVTFDAPGRHDTVHQKKYNSDRTSVITSYEARGSLISADALGHDVGDVRKIEVKENGGIFDHNHDIKEIARALNKKADIKSAWE